VKTLLSLEMGHGKQDLGPGCGFRCPREPADKRKKGGRQDARDTTNPKKSQKGGYREVERGTRGGNKISEPWGQEKGGPKGRGSQ